MTAPSSAAAPTRVRFGASGSPARSPRSPISIAPALELPRRTSVSRSVSPTSLELPAALAAFNLAYALFEVPAGWLGDVFGPRLALIRIVLWWSFFTAVTAFVGVIPAFGLGTLVAVRFLFGIGEAGAFPNITPALHNWFPVAECGIA